MADSDPRSITALRKRWQAEHFPSADQLREHRSSKLSEDVGSGANLTEVYAPAPVHRHRSQEHLEEQQGTSQGESRQSGSWGQRESLTEVAAPPPVDEKEDEHPQPLGDEEAGQSNLEKPQGHEEQGTQREGPSKFATDLYMISWLIFFSFWGTLARVGVEAITLYPNAPVPSRVLWANLGGSIIMGFLTEDRRLFQEEWGRPDPNSDAAKHNKVKKTIPLFVGLSTGFCGCFTSFSSYMRDSFLALSNDLQGPSPVQPFQVQDSVSHRNGGFSFLALCAILILHPAVSICALKTGAHFAILIQPITPTLPYRFIRRFVDPLGVFLAFGTWLGVLFMTIWPPGQKVHWRHRAILPLLLSPLGCLLRFYASKYMNARIPSFPLGTFTVNIFGTCILGLAWDLQHTSHLGASHANMCTIFTGLYEGFCGCLTTVSTWVLELDGLKIKHAWIYGLVSVGVGLGCMIIIMGSMAWTLGFETPYCN